MRFAVLLFTCLGSTWAQLSAEDQSFIDAALGNPSQDQGLVDAALGNSGGAQDQGFVDASLGTQSGGRRPGNNAGVISGNPQDQGFVDAALGLTGGAENNAGGPLDPNADVSRPAQFISMPSEKQVRCVLFLLYNC